jgi:hypothetical protein
MSHQADKHDVEAARIAASLPVSREALLSLARELVKKYHGAILAHDMEGADEASATNEAIIWKLTGGTFFGCKDSESPEAGGILVAEHCKAAPGAIPLWGQNGEFLIEVEGVRSVVEVSDGFGDSLWPQFAFHAVDTKRDFISETGFRSALPDPHYGMSVDEFARWLFAGFLKESRRPLTREYREQAKLEAWSWLCQVGDAAQDRCHEDAGGQLAFGF